MVLEINTTTFDQKVLDNTKPCVVKIFTKSCPNCKTIEPIFEQTAHVNSERFDFFELNAHENLSVAKRYKVSSVPTLLFFSHGVLVNKKTGVISRKRIEKRLHPIVGYSSETAKNKEVTGFFKLPWK